MIYILDTNIISDLIVGIKSTTSAFENHGGAGDTLGLCQPVYYELMRGFMWKGAGRKRYIFETIIMPRLSPINLTNLDWQQAAAFWAQTVRQGRQLSDIDLLIAAIAHRLNATIASSDTDFDSLSVQRADWRT